MWIFKGHFGVQISLKKRLGIALFISDMVKRKDFREYPGSGRGVEAPFFILK